MKKIKLVLTGGIFVVLFAAYGCNDTSSNSTKDSTSTVATDTSSAMHDTTKMMQDSTSAKQDTGTKGDQPLPPKD